MSGPIKCQGTNADGTPCQAIPEFINPSTGYCRSHDPAKEEARKKSGEKGAKAAARKRRQEAGLTPEELGELRNVEDAQRWSRLIAQAVGEGRISSARGSAMQRSVDSWIKQEDLRIRASRLSELERQVKALQDRKGLKVAR